MGFGGEPIGRPEVEVRVGKLKNRKEKGEMIKGWWIGSGGYLIWP